MIVLPKSPGRAAILTATIILWSTLAGFADSAEANLPLPLKVVGTRIVNSRGEPMLLRGVNAASMEWSSDGQGHILQTIRTAIRDWHVNLIRLPLSQDRWFGKAGDSQDGGEAYRRLADAVVAATIPAGPPPSTMRSNFTPSD